MLFPSSEMERPFIHSWQSRTLTRSSALANDARKGIHMIADWVQPMHLLPDSRALCLHRGHKNRDLPLIQL